MTVSALLVSHDGARWLPAVLEGLAAQTRRPDRLVGVDTGSTDATVSLLEAAPAVDTVVHAPARSAFGAAVRAGLDALPAAVGPDGPEWLWILHDDSRPAPDALERLLAAAADNPTAAILGPKIREWPSLRRLLEVGVTISGTGRRETGLERGEYDQGQHDRQRDVLAVHSAGMLVRRDVFEALGGFDVRLPLFGNDLDLGWRAARAGHRALVVPEAVVFHAEAAHRGVRRTPVTTVRPRRAERRAALFILLANCSSLAIPFVTVRLLLGSLLRALGFLLVRAPREAFDELTALAATYARPDRLVAARRARRRTATLPAKDVRHLLAPVWLPYRHGLDVVSDIASAVALSAGDATTARRAARAEATETGPVPDEAQELPEDTGLLARLLRSPTAAVFALLTVLSLLAMRDVVGAGTLSGGALLPAPDSAAGWWRVYLESWHDNGVGSPTPAPPYLLPLAVAGSLLLGNAGIVVDLLVLLCVPLGAWGGYRFLRRVTGSRASSLWGAAAYGLLPVLTGAVEQGRLGTIASAVVLPWVAHAAWFLAPEHGLDRRRRAAWRTGLWLALLTAFVPVALPVAVLLVSLVLVVAALTGARAWTAHDVVAPLVVAVALVPLLLVPWWLTGVVQAPGAWWYVDAGAPARDLLTAPGAWDLALGRPAGPAGAPGWLSAGVVLAAVAALLRSGTRPHVLRAWTVAVVGLATAVVLTGRDEWSGFALLLAQAAWVCAVAIAATGISAQLSGRSFGWQQPVGLLVVVAGLLSPVLGLFWWVATGVDGPLHRSAASDVPAYMTDAAVADPDNGVLVVRGAGHRTYEYVLLRGDGQRLGDDALRPEAADQEPLSALVGDLVTAAEADHVAELADHGVEFVYLPRPADPELVGSLDSVSGLTPASAVYRGARAWQLDADPTDVALPSPEGSWRPVLLAVQAAAVVLAVVLAAPSRKVRR